MRIVIRRSQEDMIGGGEDRITLDDLLKEAGYEGKFDIDLCEELEDDYLPLIYLLTVTV